MVTTKAGYRASRVAKKYMDDVFRTTGKRINLRQARAETALIREVIKVLAPLRPKQRNKVLRAVEILCE